MNIRSSSAQELEAIRSLHLNAFGEPEGPVIVSLVEAMLIDKSAEPRFSFVVENAGDILGHVIFSTVKIDQHPEIRASILCPLGIAGNHQKQGLGTRLIAHGLTALKQQNVEIVFVLGDPAYYSRCGFSAGHDISPPYELPYPEAWMATELAPGALANISGRVQCAESLMQREYW